MTMRMLIDARHPEETRVAVVNGTRIEEFDFEAAARKQIKGNIYLAKVTRVEPSLQAAFIEYGGNRHGFLAFSEIHPDYYQIPREDREALLREEQEIEREELELAQAEEVADGGPHDATDDEDGEPTAEGDGEDDAPPAQPVQTQAHHDDHHHERMRERRMALRRRYKIQDVIKRRQVLLVQVVKEERGNKGAALTTYLSLAGRYCVLMPNTSHGGGISRKISSAADRKRLKGIMDELRLPRGMACIVRTAGLSRTKTEIKRDFDYLCRLWDDIRELTLDSTAPALIHEDSDLIKRAIRDIYSRDIEEVIVDGDDGYEQARQFMKLLMPSHVKRVKHYIDPIPLFQRAQLEGQLNAMFNPVVQLKSGGYLVINPTEALVAIDINSGRSTREYNIEETALKTNMEAADEIARQLRLRDMAGLVVIDFIDMEHGGNVRKVERQLKEALKNDRARIQVGRISSFGLMEMSRQRLRTGVLEASTVHCPMCEGVGLVRSAPSAALAALRALEEEALRGRHAILTLRAATEVAVYVLNRKRDEVAELEERYGVQLEILPDADLLPPRFVIDGSGGAPQRPALPAPAPAARATVAVASEDDDVEVDEDEHDEEVAREEARVDDRAETSDRGDRRGRRRRRRRGGRRDDREVPVAAREERGSADERDDRDEPEDRGAPAPAGTGQMRADDDEGGRRRRRRGRRRRGRGLNGEGVEMSARREGEDGDPDGAADAIADDREDADDALTVAEALLDAASDLDEPILAQVPEPEAATPPVEDEPARKPRRRTRKAADAEAEESPSVVAGEADAALAEKPAAAPKRSRSRKAAAPTADTGGMDAPAASPGPDEAVAQPAEAPPKPRRRTRKAVVAEAEPAPDAAERQPDPAAANGAADPEKLSGGAEEADADTGESPAETQPRRGWWQRTFGG